MLNDFSKEINKENHEKGFWDSERQIGTLLMLIVSELSEALEADRNNRHCKLSDTMKYQGYPELTSNEFMIRFNEEVKDTFEDEIADTFIRLADLCGERDIDIDWHINAKIRYNKFRAFKHGKEY